MTGIFIFPVKPDDKEYQYYKEPRKVLEIDDDKVLSFTTMSRCIYYNIRHDNQWDELSDSKVVDMWNEKHKPQVELSGRRSGLGYTTSDKSYFIRIVRK